MKKKILVTVPAALLLLALYIIIFGFSSQDGEQSGNLSRLISEKCVEFINSLSGSPWNEVVMNKLAEYFEHPIRKLAHFSEYACMGGLVYIILSQWMTRGKPRYLVTVLWVFLSASADEFHQLFVPGRYGSLADVLLDTCGGVTGMGICVFIRKFYKGSVLRKRNKKRDISGKEPGNGIKK